MESKMKGEGWRRVEEEHEWEEEEEEPPGLDTRDR